LSTKNCEIKLLSILINSRAIKALKMSSVSRETQKKGCRIKYKELLEKGHQVGKILRKWEKIHVNEFH
jgi:hypothetical protein